MSSYVKNIHAGWKRYLVAKEMVKGLLEHDTRTLMDGSIFKPTNEQIFALVDGFYKQELVKIYKELTRMPKKVKKTGKKFLTSVK